MVKWPWSRKPQKPDKPPYLACPGPCRWWASKENLDKALAQPSLQTDLTCENCGKTNPRYAWEAVGLKESKVVEDAWATFGDRLRRFMGK